MVAGWRSDRHPGRNENLTVVLHASTRGVDACPRHAARRRSSGEAQAAGPLDQALDPRGASPNVHATHGSPNATESETHASALWGHIPSTVAT